MNSLTWNQIVESLEKPIMIPDVSSHQTVLQAALEYAKCGWYVLPINPGTKNPGSVVGKAWQEKSTRNEQRVRELFRYSNTAIALHVGRSGAIAFDVDEPNNLSELLKHELLKDQVPFQSTRLSGDMRRGHYLFKVPNQLSYGNSLGSLGSGWGDIRGHNAIIVAAPSKHLHPEGRYQWIKTGNLPLLPQIIADKLPIRRENSISSLSLRDAQEFLNANSKENYPEKLQSRLRWLIANPPKRNNRHSTFQRFICLVLKDSVVGFYKASEALNETQQLFNLMKPESEQTPNEFEGMAYWAMGVVESMTLSDKALHAYTNAPHLESEIMKWVNNHVG